MANTLKFGAGNWATKEGSTLAYNDENNNFKPLPFTFTRASNATVVNKAGLIETVGNGIPRIDFLGNTQGALKLEPQRTNVITYSEAFDNSYWTKSGASIQGDPSTAGSELVTNGVDWVGASGSTPPNGWIDGSSGSVPNYSVASGVLTLTASTTGTRTRFIQIISVEVGKKYKFTYNGWGGTASSTLFLGSSASQSDYHFSAGTYASSYEGVITATTNEIYIDFRTSGVIGSSLTIDNISVKEVQGFLAPDGTNNAYKLVEGTNNGNHIIYKNNVNTGSGKSTLSLKAKAAERNWIFLYDTEQNEGCYFDLQNGVVGSRVGSPDSYSITSLQNGWYDITLTTTSTTRIDFQVHLAEADNDNTYQGNGTSGIYIAFAQAEFGSYATSYIPTQGSAVTRLVETCSQTTPDGVIGQTEGSIYTEFKYLGIGNSVIPLVLNNGTNSNRIQIEINSAGGGILYVVSGGTFQASISLGSFVGNTNYKIGIAYKVNDFVAYKNGIQIGSDNSGNVPSLNQIQLGKELSASYSGLSSQETKLYNTRLSNSELASLTQV